MKNYESIGSRGAYQFQERLGGIVYGLEDTYQTRLRPYGVVSASLDYGDYNEKDSCVSVTLKLLFKNGKHEVRSWDQHVDEGALEASDDFLKAYCGASEIELWNLTEALENGEDLALLEPCLWSFLAQEYALSTLPNENDGGEWIKQDEELIVELFDLQLIA